MVRISTFFLSLTILLAGFRPLPVEAQTIPSSYRFFERRQEAGIIVAVTSQNTGRFGFGPNPGPAVGARYGVHLGGPFGLEGVLGYQPTTRDVIDPTRVEGDRVVGESDVELVSFDARLSFSLTGDRSWKRLNPLLFFGGGIIHDLAGEGGDDSRVLVGDRFEFGSKFLALFGGGIRWFLNDRFLVRADMALTMNRINSPSGFLDLARGLTGVSEKEWVSGPTFSIGTAIRF